MTDLARIERELRAVPVKSRRAKQVNGLYQVFREPDYPALADLVGRWLEELENKLSRAYEGSAKNIEANYALQARLDAAEREKNHFETYLRQELMQLRGALSQLYEETADYIRLNNLGDVHHNQSMQRARAVLADEPSNQPSKE